MALDEGKKTEKVKRWTKQIEHLLTQILDDPPARVILHVGNDVTKLKIEIVQYRTLE